MVSPADLTGGGSSEEDEQARRWAAALALVEQLADLPEEEREDALRNADIEPEARELARRMLASEHRRSILDDPLPPLLGSEDIAASLTGRQIGRWMLTSPLGRGGMSVVYHARSLVVPLGQEAAVKLLSLAASTPGGRARFEREIRILAKLRHPGIAPIFDAGVADDGTPWFSMALVEGTDVATWQREHAPGPREAVELEALADMVMAVMEGGIVLSKALNDPPVLAQQVLLLRTFFKLLFAGPAADGSPVAFSPNTP